MHDITYGRLRELLDYNLASGLFRWRVSRGRMRRGAIAGTVVKGYNCVRIDGKRYRSARLAWLYMTGAPPKGEIDHCDGNSRNDAFNNLRDCTSGQNKLNTRPNRDTTSQYKGVYLEKSSNRWATHACLNGKKRNLGRFNTGEEAAQAYNAFMLKNCDSPDYLRLNKIGD